MSEMGVINPALTSDWFSTTYKPYQTPALIVSQSISSKRRKEEKCLLCVRANAVDKMLTERGGESSADGAGEAGARQG